jgi:hypothetical protein|tara:strand:- start:785 stop:1162 length:378 start_codon:yes stop_codon:yes gene_type:complete
MNDMIVLGCIAAVGFLIAFAVFASVYSKNSSLCDAQVGQVFNFEYLQPLNGEPKRWKARVVEPVVYRSDSKIERMNQVSNYRKNDPEFQRTNHLVTCETQDGEYRQFYCERVKNCRRSLLGFLTS